MRNKQDPAAAADAEEQALEHKVDVMMDPNIPDAAPNPAGLSSTKTPATAAPIDIFHDPQTAPTVSSDLLKKINVTDGTEAKAEAPAKAPVPVASEPAPATSEPAPAEESTPEPKVPDAKIEDPATEAAVDEIAANDGDTLLAVQDAEAGTNRASRPAKKRSWKEKLRSLVRNKWFWAGVAVFVILLAAIPWTRYKVAGLVIHKELAVTVLDSTTNTPVSNATVSFNGHHGETNGEGIAKFRVPVGNSSLTVSKQYYKDSTESLTVGFGGAKPQKITLTATGRQVPVEVVNKITGKPVADAVIKAHNTTAKTDKSGKATIVLPASPATDKATITTGGFNDTTFTLEVTGTLTPANTVGITPVGHIYFLSNLSGKIDVVETNLDGSNRQTVVAGTGQEDPNNTSLLASRDWRYAVLKSHRSGQDGLYLIDTSDNKVTEFDSSNSNFTLIGWYNHQFMYDLLSNTVPQTQTNHEVIKSYDADKGQLNQLDSNQVQGDSTNYAYQTFSNYYILSNQLLYTAQWYSFGSSVDVSTLNDVIRGVQPNGQSKKDYQTFPVASTGYINAQLYEPQDVYYSVYDNTTQKNTFYEFQNQAVKVTADVNDSTFNKAYPTFLLSPSGSQTFWTELRDGKNTLFIGDANAQSPKQIASLSDYSPYGWYSDNYILVAKNSSELYVMPTTGPIPGKQPLKITDYYKPAQSFNGYGYGYGGL